MTEGNGKIKIEDMPVEARVNWSVYNEIRSASGGRGAKGGVSTHPSFAMFERHVNPATGQFEYEGIIVDKVLGNKRYEVNYDSSYVYDWLLRFFTDLKLAEINLDNGKLIFSPIYHRIFRESEGDLALYASEAGVRLQKEQELEEARKLKLQYPGLSDEVALQMHRSIKAAASKNIEGHGSEPLQEVPEPMSKGGKRK